MKTNKSHDLLCASWRTRKVSGKIQPESKGLGIRGLIVLSPDLDPKAENQEHWCPRAGQDRGLIPSRERQRRQIHPSSAFLFYSSLQWIGWYPTTLGRSVCFTQFMDSDANLFWKHLTDTPRNNVLPATCASLSPVRLTYKVNYCGYLCIQCLHQF